MDMIMADGMDNFKGMTPEQRRSALLGALALTHQALVRAAMIVRAMEEAGDVIPKLPILPLLRKIAYGQILPDLVVKFGGTSILPPASNLTIPDQQRLLSGKPLPVAVLENGEPTHRLVDPMNLSRAELSQVFAKDHIRDEAEQVQFIHRSRQSQTTPEAKPVESVVYNRRAKTMSLHGEFTRAQLTAALLKFED